MWSWMVFRLRSWQEKKINKKNSPWMLLSPSVSPSPRRSEGERDRRRGGPRVLSHLSICGESVRPSVRPSALPSHNPPLPALALSLITHSPLLLLLYRSRRCVSGSRQCSPAQNTAREFLAQEEAGLENGWID